MQNGNLIAIYRLKNNLTQKEMATLLKVSHSTYKLYELNLRVMKLETLNLISNLFNLSLDNLLNINNTIPKSLNREINYHRLSLNLKLIRKKNHLSAIKLAKEFNITKTTIYKYENYPKTISLTYLYLYAKKFNISVDYLCSKKEVL